jgi:putative ABC transport system permease protein
LPARRNTGPPRFRFAPGEKSLGALNGCKASAIIGDFLAALTSSALGRYDTVFSLPVASLVLFAVLAIVRGMLAAILPARRASRLNVLEALRYEQGDARAPP